MDGWEDSDKSGSRWKDSKAAGGLRAAGSSLSDSGRDEMSQASSRGFEPVKYRHGGRVKRTGPAVLHKNERVIPASKRKRVEKLMRGKKMRMTTRGRR